MIKIYEDNGLPFYNAAWIRDRKYIQDVLESLVKGMLWEANRSWDIRQVEAPCLIPASLVSAEYKPQLKPFDGANYTQQGSEVFGEVTELEFDDPVYKTQDFYLKPETTSSSYEYAKHLIEHQETKPPLCIWQTSKSFRRENDQVTANVRLKEFYQQEFQCIYTEDTKKDYHELAELLSKELSGLLGVETRLVDSDRLPSYSSRTLDIEAKTPHKWLEVCSISKRNDVPFEWNGKKLLNTEFAFGLDRLTYVKRGIK